MSFSFASRLVTQRMRLHERTVSCEMEQETLVVKQKLVEKLKEKFDEVQEQLAKVEKLRGSLAKMDADSEVAYNNAKQHDEDARNELSADFKAQIDEVNEQLQLIAQREAKANRLNATYKQQIEIYGKQADSGEGKYDEYMTQRETEMQKVREKQESDRAKIPEMQETLEKETKELEDARAVEAELKAKMDVYLERYREIQVQLDASKKTYEEAKKEKERQSRNITGLMSSKEMTVRRAEQSRAERDKLYSRVRKLEEQLEELNTQTYRFNQMCAVFEGREAPKPLDGIETSQKSPNNEGKADEQSADATENKTD